MTNNGDELCKRREEIDQVDDALLRLLNQRAQLACAVASVKRCSSMPVYDGRREQQILERICASNHGPLDSQGITRIFRCIIHESRKLEESCARREQANSFSQENRNGDQYDN